MPSTWTTIFAFIAHPISALIRNNASALSGKRDSNRFLYENSDLEEVEKTTGET
jgi:hypothetical protein